MRDLVKQSLTHDVNAVLLKDTPRGPSLCPPNLVTQWYQASMTQYLGAQATERSDQEPVS